MYLIIFLILAMSSLVYLKLAEKFNIIDKPNQRSSHTVPTIRGGGILFVFAFLIYQIQVEFQEIYLLLGVLIVAVVSFIDDMITLSSRVRFPFQLIAIALVVFQIGIFNESIWLAALIIFAGTGYINFSNFMDGINGITGLYSLAVLIGVYLLNLISPVIELDLIRYEIIAILVFGYYNFRKKARFFAGDIGSIAIALILLYMVMSMVYKLNSPLYLLLLVVFGSDAFLTMVYRAIIKEKITDPHRHHIYQKLVDRTQLSHLQVAGLYAVLQLIIIGVVFLVLPYSTQIHYTATIGVIVIMIAVYVISFQKLEKVKELK
ncbi:UDP-N-acetylmuramyl pentapeptide phosphotransferase/UDP-N-acetylglucosamine-1-phosphate transferase [Wenyingzhuangia heitensis]|uniref:UDP-N-acetylmuramyl pentapeptide phosphotransferase/UDP-N-acetylglucosamine-1-phosphate transferase n=1 Tax=Wenyingzhuangia heitensis TaxID=1487859 RepID=A0ABX0U7L1_9FLAO|nr:glycosyltransferase family 4 protein [Wenyingzhuangia heitensis]NIJ44319.1 UDP-N-acetylmuramyl pentapeptide phosphotransferase/UDP-N-acetylglucosamine-1-phosphate transferase [Wenyingzhuangia heitensis]